MDFERRNFFRRKMAKPEANTHILPWLNSHDVLYEACNRCDICAKSCPEKIIVKGDGGYPTIDFHKGECTFCAKCASACPEPDIFIQTTSPPWNFIANLGEQCLAKRGVACQSCQDVCETRAIRFVHQLGSTAQAIINLDDCTGCGACVSLCPTKAITIVKQDNHNLEEVV